MNHEPYEPRSGDRRSWRRRAVLLGALTFAGCSAADDLDTPSASEGSTTSVSAVTAERPEATDLPAERADAAFGPLGPGTTLMASRLEFGECGGFCITEIRFRSAAVEIAFSTWGNVQHSVSGQLTDAGQRERDEVGERIGETRLEEIFGCPDCNDGGALSLTVEDAVGDRFVTTFGETPEALRRATDFVESVRQAARECVDSHLISLDPSCVGLDEVDDGVLLGPGESAELVAGGYDLAQCDGHCSASLELLDELVSVSIFGSGSLVESVRSTGRLTPAGVAAVDGLAPLLAGLDDHYGCPDCVEQSREYFEASDPTHSSYQVTSLEFENPPAAIAPVSELIHHLIAGLRECRSTDLVDVDEPCEAAPDPILWAP